MGKKISKVIYFYYAITLIIFGLITKYFLVDDDLGARFKGFNNRLLASDIIFLCAILLIIIGLIFFAIRKCKGSTLSNSTIIISAILIIPLTFILAIIPLLQTLYPGEVGQNTYALVFGIITTIGVFGAIAWIILLIIIFIGQTIKILTYRK